MICRHVGLGCSELLLSGTLTLWCPCPADVGSSSHRCATLRAKFIDFASPHKVLTKGQVLELHRLGDVLKRHLYAIAAAAVRAARNGPLLYSYQADGAPVLSMTTVVQQVTDARKVVRTAGAAMEFLVERAYIKSIGERRKVHLVHIRRSGRVLSRVAVPQPRRTFHC